MRKYIRLSVSLILFILTSFFSVLIAKNIIEAKSINYEKPVINYSGNINRLAINTDKNIHRIADEEIKKPDKNNETKTGRSLKSIIFQIIGYISSILVFSAFYMKTMIPLRIVAICSNFTFITYAVLGGLYPILILHGVLLPLNILRLRQMLKLIKKVKQASRGENNLEFLTPYMSSEEYENGQVLFNKGDRADKIYFIKEGDIVLPELQKELGSGTTLGEVGIFAPDNVRACSAVATGKVEALTITSEKVLQLYYQNPTFGFFLIRTIAEIASKGSELKTGMVVSLDELEAAEDSSLSESDFEDTSENDTDEDKNLEPDESKDKPRANFKGNMDFLVEDKTLYFFGELIWEEIKKYESKFEDIKQSAGFEVIDITDVYKIDSSGMGLIFSITALMNNAKIKIKDNVREVRNSTEIISTVINYIS